MVRVRFPEKAAIFFVFLSACAASTVHAADKKAAEQAGAALYRDKGCGFCHGANLEGTRKAPSLAEIRKQRPWTDEKITQQILDGGAKMPPFDMSLSEEEVRQLIAFLRAKDRPVLPRAAQPAALPAPQQ